MLSARLPQVPPRTDMPFLAVFVGLSRLSLLMMPCGNTLVTDQNEVQWHHMPEFPIHPVHSE